jgi:hypothetical protein
MGDMLGVRRLLLMAVAASLGFQPAVIQAQQQQPPVEARRVSTNEFLTDAAITAIIIAASVAAYKAMGRPCACPEDTMRNGRICGGSSAWSRPGGFKPLCYATDITPAMINAYRSTKVIPPLR